MNKLLLLVMILALSACSNQALYENVRLHQRQECLKEPPATYADCMDRTYKSFEEYERERKEALDIKDDDDKETDADGS